MSSRNFFIDNEDLQFHIRTMDWASLLPLVEAYENPEDAFSDPEEAREFYAEMLSTIGQFSAEQIAPYTTELDTQHPIQEGEEILTAPRMKTILDGLAQLGAMGLILPRRIGGLNSPMVLNSALSAPSTPKRIMVEMTRLACACSSMAGRISPASKWRRIRRNIFGMIL